MDRLNRSSLFEPITENDVAVVTDEKPGLADIRIRLKERKGRSWLLSGPLGPLSLGSLQFSLASRLPSWGEGLLELSSWYASFSLYAYRDPFSLVVGSGSANKLLPVFALQRPFIPAQSWASGVSIAPQLGWRGTLTNYAWNQVSERVFAWLSATGTASTILPVTVERPDGDAMLFCEPRPPRLHRVRRAAVFSLQLLSAVPVL